MDANGYEKWDICCYWVCYVRCGKTILVECKARSSTDRKTKTQNIKQRRGVHGFISLCLQHRYQGIFVLMPKNAIESLHHVLLLFLHTC